MHSLLEDYIKELEEIVSIEEYEAFTHKLIQMLRTEKYDNEIIQRVRNIGKFVKNDFSDKAAMESMQKSKNNLIFYLENLLFEKQGNSLRTKCKYLETYLNNFYLFLEAFKEIVPDKRASLTVENLKKITIENEYDLQHLLYAVLRPFYADIRKEVTEDSGVGAVRSDIKIPSLNAVIEAKCTRKSMKLKKLTEEIEADIVHYNADFIYFYIYDKEKLIKDRAAFGLHFNGVFDGKEVSVAVLQPVNM